jgi:hypothetical protein
MKFMFRFLIFTSFALTVTQVSWVEGAFAKATACETCANFAKVSDQIYRGGRPESDVSFQELSDMGIKTVIDLQGGDIGNSTFGWIAGIMEPGEAPSWIAFEKKSVEALGMKFVNVPINSLDRLNSVQGYGLGRAIALMNDVKNQPVYVHCEHGVDRTGLLVALYRVYSQNWTRQAAHDEMVDMGHGTLRQLVTGDMDDFFWAATEGMP